MRDSYAIIIEKELLFVFIKVPLFLKARHFIY